MDRRSEKSIADIKEKEPERAYGCPCGKTYLSYPALFTHVKQKHDGKVKKQLCSLLANSLSQRLVKSEEDQRLESMYFSILFSLKMWN